MLSYLLIVLVSNTIQTRSEQFRTSTIGSVSNFFLQGQPKKEMANVNTNPKKRKLKHSEEPDIDTTSAFPNKKRRYDQPKAVIPDTSAQTTGNEKAAKKRSKNEKKEEKVDELIATRAISVKSLHKKVTISESWYKYHWYDLQQLGQKGEEEGDQVCVGWKFPRSRFFPTNEKNVYTTWDRNFETSKELYESLVNEDKKRNAKAFEQHLMTEGTFKDKVNMYVMRLQQCVVTRLSHLDKLLDIIKNGAKREVLYVVPLLMSLFVDMKKHNDKRGILPSNRHLMTFNDRMKEQMAAFENTITNSNANSNSNGNEMISQMDLILWYFEHLLKSKYGVFVDALESYTSETSLVNLRTLCTKSMYKLLSHKPELEHVLLNLLVVKMNERDTKYVQTVEHYLLQCCTRHPLMKPHVIKEVHHFVLRTHASISATAAAASAHGVLSAVKLLHQIRFTLMEAHVATYVCSIYMDLFKQMMAYSNAMVGANDESQSANDKDIITHNAHINANTNTGTTNGVNASNDKRIIKIHKLMQMSKKKRNVHFKSHKKDHALWKHCLELTAITPKLIGLLLKGISYAFPFAKLNLAVLRDDLDFIYKMALRSSFHVAIIALQFTFRVETIVDNRHEDVIDNPNSDTNSNANIDPNIKAVGITSSPFEPIGVTDKTPRYKVSKELNEFNAMGKGLYQVPSDRFYNVLLNVCSRWDLTTFGKPEMLFNLLYNAVRCDNKQERILTFLKKLIQIAMNSCCIAIGWQCGALYLTSNLFQHHFSSSFPSQYSKQFQFWELTLLTQHFHPAVHDFAKQLLLVGSINYTGDPIHDFERKVLFEKFVQLVAHKTTQMPEGVDKSDKNKKSKSKDKDIQDEEEQLRPLSKKEMLRSFLPGDEFIALYNDQSRYLTTVKKKKQNIDINEPGSDESAFENSSDEEDFIMKYMHKHYGKELNVDLEDDYDMSEYAKKVGFNDTDMKYDADDDNDMAADREDANIGDDEDAANDLDMDVYLSDASIDNGDDDDTGADKIDGEFEFAPEDITDEEDNDENHLQEE
ncbi:CCAAT-box-binding transcription factor [Reticulomyxa filosa]|uniref:CCAAT-box-binding transcription factor n=1 Tax=Reticulomyxa filosa TaxID=46433 RepID=X6LYY3_RETFI|nr:CCAAT-box-binding transcription factor [Reticulomyxa filosa]|eukprot:ETO07143.1 CCAAT-box-binding transcription factor [Reticulomyxa filosa]